MSENQTKHGGKTWNVTGWEIRAEIRTLKEDFLLKPKKKVLALMQNAFIWFHWCFLCFRTTANRPRNNSTLPGTPWDWRGASSKSSKQALDVQTGSSSTLGTLNDNHLWENVTRGKFWGRLLISPPKICISTIKLFVYWMLGAPDTGNDWHLTPFIQKAEQLLY